VGAQSANREADLILELETVFARASAEHVVKIVDELVDNALKFSGPGAAVRVSLAPCAGHAVLRIADSGRGMASEHVTAIAPHVQFERGRFEQQGAGLGLTIARRLAELHGGNLTLFSAVDAGTVVEVRIPVASASPLHALSGHA
jgi:signal transduction histidine kinase